MTAELQQIPIGELKPAEDNIRDEVGDVTELAASIATVGLVEPVVATRENGHFVLVAGERRLAAAKKAGLKTVPTIVRDYDEEQRVEVMLIENLQREGLTALEEARAYKRLLDLGHTQRELAKRIGRSQPHISKRVALLELPQQVAEHLDSGGITIADAVQLTKLKDSPELVLEAIAPGTRLSNWPFEDRVEELLAKKERTDKIATERAKVEAEGLRIVEFDGDDSYYPKLPKGVVKIAKGGGYDAIRIDPAKHAEQECHAVAIHPQTFDRILVCTDRKKAHPKLKTDVERQREQYTSTSSRTRTSKEDAEAQAAEKEALEQAEERRHAFYGQIVKAKHNKSDVIQFALRRFLTDRLYMHELDIEIACKALGITDQRFISGKQAAPLLAYADKGEKELLQVAHAIALAMPEVENFGQWNPFQAWGDEEREQLAVLEKHGYELSDVEKKKLGKKSG